YFGKVKEDNEAKLAKMKGIYEYANKLNPPRQPDPHVLYRFIAQQASIFPPGDEREEKVFTRLIKYGMVKDKTEGIMQKIKLALNWADDNRQEEKFEVQLSGSQKKAVQELIE